MVALPNYKKEIETKGQDYSLALAQITVLSDFNNLTC